MAYQALARKWRPRRFSEVVGQEHVVKALTHALQADRMHHAYLFTGTRGVGKTTLARILAKALNCLSRDGFEPCGECPHCRELDEGRFVDLMEVDAASRTKVEDTRDLMENVQYAPSQGRYKIYLIDEVHMLSGHSFNALLKTLEEPPAHVKFLLATTDPQKIPVTVLSRCLQFNLKRLVPDQIRGQMEAILAQEGIPFEAGAIRALARAADGSMRDGLSLLDQAIAHGGGHLEEGPVSAMLGTVSKAPVFDLLDALAQADAPGLLNRIAELSTHSPDFRDILQQLLLALHHLALAQWAPDAIRREEDAPRYQELAQRISPEDVQLYYQIGLVSQRDLPLAPDPRSGFEMALLRMLAFRPTDANTAAPVSPPASARSSAPATPSAPTKTPPPTRAAVATPTRSPEPSAAAAPPPAAPELPPEPTKLSETSSRPSTPEPQAAGFPAPTGTIDWATTVSKLGLAGLTQQLANHCELLHVDDERIELSLDQQFAQIRTAQLESKLEKALQHFFGRPLKLKLTAGKPAGETPALMQKRQQDERQKAAEQEIEQDPNVLAMKELFDARIVPGSIKPLD